MSEYQLVESFNVDDGSLNGLTNDHCFCLRVEWAKFHDRIMAGEQFTELCHTANAQRLSAMAERHGRFVEHHRCSKDWSRIIVGANRASSNQSTSR